MLIVDIIRLYVDGRSGNLMYVLNTLFTTIMIISTPVLPMLWTIYIDYKVFLDKKRIKKNMKYILIPSIINLIFTFISLFGCIYGKGIFHIDSFNFYHRGDKALISVAKILKKGFNKDDFISRYAGDEFIVVCEVEDLDQLKDKINKLDITIDMFNKTAGVPYKISMSKGYDIFITNEDIEDDVFINRIDSLMYKDKEKYKANKLTRKKA